MTGERTYSTFAIARLAGITVRRVQLWSECGLLTPGFEGRYRTFTSDQALLARIAAELTARGMSLARVQKVQYELGVLARRYQKLGDRGDIHFLLVDPKQCTPAPNAETALLFAARSRHAVIILDLHEIARRLTQVDGSAAAVCLQRSAAAAHSAGGLC